MLCSHFEAGRCGSCTLIRTPYQVQIQDKQSRCTELLAAPQIAWLPPVTSPQTGFRNKAKMVVTGTFQDPILGILDAEYAGIELTDCPLYDGGMQELLAGLGGLISSAKIVPYDLTTRRGELKYVLVTQSPDGAFMVRLVSRSQEPVTRIQKALPAFHAAHPQVHVVTVNVQPHHSAVLEGDLEIVLTEQVTLPMVLPADGAGSPDRPGSPPITLHLRPQSFFQTNTVVAAAMYGQAQTWIAQSRPETVWDLFCGVGGFALHAAPYANEVRGIEISEQAIESARTSATELGYAHVTFETGDATTFSRADRAMPDLVIVNPPRRGIGPELATWLERSGVETVIYSSCNVKTLEQDLKAMPSLRPVSGRLLDMFPNTSHFEVMVLLERIAAQ